MQKKTKDNAYEILKLDILKPNLGCPSERIHPGGQLSPDLKAPRTFPADLKAPRTLLGQNVFWIIAKNHFEMSINSKNTSCMVVSVDLHVFF